MDDLQSAEATEDLVDLGLASRPVPHDLGGGQRNHGHRVQKGDPAMHAGNPAGGRDGAARDQAGLGGGVVRHAECPAGDQPPALRHVADRGPATGARIGSPLPSSRSLDPPSAPCLPFGARGGSPVGIPVGRG